MPYEEGVAKTRVLVAFENESRVFRDAIASVIRINRPRVEVVAAELGVLGSKVAQFDPHLVICSQPNTVDPSSRSAWFELPPDPNRLAEICLDGLRVETANPALEELLRVVDETEKLIRKNPDPGNC